MQIAAFTGVFANGGTYLSPTFTEAIVDEYSQSFTQSLYAPVQRGVCSSDSIDWFWKEYYTETGYG